MRAELAGGTRWKVFVLVLVPCAVVIAALATALLTGVLAAALAISRMPVQLKVDRLVGDGLTLYADEVTPIGDHAQPSARAGISNATISGLCLGLGADVPVLGKVAVKATTPADVQGTNLVLDAQNLNGDLEAHDATVGQDASRFTLGVAASRGPEGRPGLQAGHVLLHNDVGVQLYSLKAGSLKLSHLSVSTTSGTTKPCS